MPLPLAAATRRAPTHEAAQTRSPALTAGGAYLPDFTRKSALSLGLEGLHSSSQALRAGLPSPPKIGGRAQRSAFSVV